MYVKHLLGQWAHQWPHAASLQGRRTDFADMLLAWWNRWLKEDESVDTGPRVEVQDSDHRWRRAKNFPLKRATERTLYLGADGTLTPKPADHQATTVLGPGTRNRYLFLSGNESVYNEIPADRHCATCATFTYDVTGELHLSGMPSLDLALVPKGPSGHVSAFVFRVDTDNRWHLLGWGASDLRFPQGGYEAHPVEPGETVRMNLPLQPLDAVVHDGEQLMVILDQGNADHMPGAPFYPVELQYGAGVGALHFDQVTQGQGLLRAAGTRGRRRAPGGWLVPRVAPRPERRQHARHFLAVDTAAGT